MYISVNKNLKNTHTKIIYIYIYIYIWYIYIYIYIYIYMVLTTEGLFEVAIESWPWWELNPQQLNSVTVL